MPLHISHPDSAPSILSALTPPCPFWSMLEREVEVIPYARPSTVVERGSSRGHAIPNEDWRHHLLARSRPTSFSPLKTKRHCKSTPKFSNIGPPPSRSEFTIPYYVYMSFPSMVKAPSSRVQSTKLQHYEVCHRKQELETSIQKLVGRIST
jgi:hypothetical protein